MARPKRRQQKLMEMPRLVSVMLASSLDSSMLDLRSKSVRRAGMARPAPVGTWGASVTRRFQACGIRLQLKPHLRPRPRQGRGQTVRDGGAAGDKDSRLGSARARWRARAAARSADDKGFF